MLALSGDVKEFEMGGTNGIRRVDEKTKATLQVHVSLSQINSKWTVVTHFKD